MLFVIGGSCMHRDPPQQEGGCCTCASDGSIGCGGAGSGAALSVVNSVLVAQLVSGIFFLKF